MTVVKWTTSAHMVACTYSDDNASSHREFSTSSLWEGLKFLYPDSPWLKHSRMNSFACNVESVIYLLSFLIHASPCLGYFKGLKKGKNSFSHFSTTCAKLEGDTIWSILTYNCHFLWQTTGLREAQQQLKTPLGVDGLQLCLWQFFLIGPSLFGRSA